MNTLNESKNKWIAELINEIDSNQAAKDAINDAIGRIESIANDHGDSLALFAVSYKRAIWSRQHGDMQNPDLYDFLSELLDDPWCDEAQDINSVVVEKLLATKKPKA